MCIPGWQPARRATISSTSGSGAPDPVARRASRFAGEVWHEPPGDRERGAGGTVGLGRAVLLEEVGIVVGEGPEETRGVLGHIAEEDGAEAIGRGHDRAGSRRPRAGR